MKNLNYQLKQLCQRNHDGSYATRHNRERTLTLIADQLQAAGLSQDERAVAKAQTH